MSGIREQISGVKKVTFGIQSKGIFSIAILTDYLFPSSKVNLKTIQSNVYCSNGEMKQGKDCNSTFLLCFNPTIDTEIENVKC